MRIVVDTNVLISGTFWTGDSFKILEKVERREITLILSEEIIEEYNRVLNYPEILDKIKDKSLEAKFVLEELIQMSTIVEPKEKIKVMKDDPDDDKFLEAGIEAGVDYIVSQDKHLLRIKEFRGIKIVKPDKFLSR
jgi:uncharacterized protein